MPYNLSTMQSIFCNNKEIIEIRCNGSLVYQKQSGPDYSEPFYVENITNENETLSIVKNYNNAPTLTIEYSTDKSTWQTLGTTSTTALTKTLAPGEKVYLRCNTNTWYGNYYYNKIQGVSKVGGNIMSLLYGSNFTGEETSFPTADNYTFSYLFNPGYGNTSILQNASELLLPATILTERCYNYMFSRCSSLTSAPALPATTLASYCYYYMFDNCSSLTSSPILPATTLADACYQGMFQSCTALTQAPALPATTLTNNCYNTMFFQCTSLTSAPTLPATTLVEYSYNYMFYNCTSLNNVKCLATSGITNSTNGWLDGVASTGTFTKAAGVTWPTGVNGIPEGWTVVEV